MDLVEGIKNALVPLISKGSWETIESLHRELGIEWREDLGPGSGKEKYVKKVLANMEDNDILNLADRCLNHFGEKAVALQNAIWRHESNGESKITALTRRALATALDGHKMNPEMSPLDFINRFIEPLSPAELSNRSMIEYGKNNKLLLHRSFWTQLMNTEESRKKIPYSHLQLLEDYGFMEWPDRRVFQFVEELVHPLARKDEEQQEWVNLLNKVLKKDGFSLQKTSYMSGEPIYEVKYSKGVEGTPKNLIFAADKYKPEIGFRDAINNDIIILKNEKHCLVYDNDISSEGLLWADLIEWWSQRTNTDPSHTSTRRALGKRLLRSVQSVPERNFLAQYFRQIGPLLTDSLPALIPQVYLHYDPITIQQLRERGDKKRFLVQRMDFLMLLPNNIRVVMEIDGKQHYSEKNNEIYHPSPSKYAETVSSGRMLQLMRYEVYRFGGYELYEESKAIDTVTEFFNALFRHHGVLTNQHI